jgi:hypothetical protein
MMNNGLEAMICAKIFTFKQLIHHEITSIYQSVNKDLE